jgi:3',5'-nucleoside bisphosphate phosphatase
MIVADLHTHSTASDGDCPPAEVVREAHSLGLCAIALTDHDTVAGIAPALRAGKDAGIIVIPGMEVTVCFRGPAFTGSLHYLLYFSQDFLNEQAFCSSVKDILSAGRGEKLVSARMAALNVHFGPHGSRETVLKMDFTKEDLRATGEAITRRHFVRALIERHGLTEDIANRLMSNQSPAYVPSGIEPAGLQPLFDHYPCVKILAHPAAGSFSADDIHSKILPPLETVERLLPKFIAQGLDGIEVYYPGHRPEHIKLLEQWAKERDLIMTGGSDFHDRKLRPMGTAGIDDKGYQMFLSRLSRCNCR